MAVTLPTTPAPARMAPRLLTWANELTPVLGGPTMRLNRLGSRWEARVVMPPMTYEAAMAWAAAFTKAETDTVVMNLYQPGFNPGSPGTTLVNGAGQLGMSLNVDGFSGAYQVKPGQFFSIVISGQRYLYQATAAVTAASGAATLAFGPMLRKSPPNNGVVELAQPKIEGFAKLDDSAREVTADRLVHGFSFTITERE